MERPGRLLKSVLSHLLRNGFMFGPATFVNWPADRRGHKSKDSWWDLPKTDRQNDFKKCNFGGPLRPDSSCDLVQQCSLGDLLRADPRGDLVQHDINKCMFADLCGQIQSVFWSKVMPKLCILRLPLRTDSRCDPVQNELNNVDL